MKKTAPVRRRKVTAVPKKCYFCEEKKLPWFSDSEVLRRYITERGKIVGRSRSGICAIHQRKLSAAIKQARHVSLLPFIVTA